MNRPVPRRVRQWRLRGLRSLAFALGGMVAAISGCRRAESNVGAAASQPPRWTLTGEVLSTDPAQKSMRVRHDEIQGLMPAMTMDFPVSAGDATLFKSGDRIRGELVKTADGEFRLERVFRRDQVADDTVAAATRELRQEVSSHGRNPYRGDPGDTLPNFALYDQTGGVVSFGRFRGKQVMLNFIYTRCPIATMCPAATTKMIQTQALAREGGIGNLELISITMDPAYDTPGMLKEYADSRGIDTRNFSFLTGPERAIKDLLAHFGVIAEFEGDLIKHTLTTLLIDESGRIIQRADGSQWAPKDFVAKMKRP